MRNLSIKLLLAGLGICATFTGCASSTPNLDSKFGDALNTIKAQQTLNPDAPLNQKATTGLDGKAADIVIDKYHKSYESPPPASSTFTIGIGSGSGTTSK